MIVIIKLQPAIIDTLGMIDVYPCVGPLVTPLVYQMSEYKSRS